MLRGSVLSVPDFRRLWLCGLAVSVARWLEMLVIGVVVWQQTQSAFLVAAMTLLRLLPMGLFGAVLGVVADRVERRGALLVVLGIQGGGMAALALLALAGDLAVWQIALASVASGVGWATDNPVRRMMLGDILGAPRMATGMSLDVMGNNASRIGGPAAGGMLLAAFGPWAAFAAALALYLVAIALAARLDHRGRPGPTRPGSVLAEVAGSFRLALRVPALRGIMVVTVIFNVFAWPFASMVPVIGQEVLHLGPEGVGFLASMEGLGALAGALAITLRARTDQYPRLFLGGAALYLGMVTAFALAPTPLLAGAALALVGLGGAAFASMQATMVYLVTPPELRSRALGVLSVAVGSGLLGFLHIGILANLVGARAATALIGAEGLLALVLTRRIWRGLRG
ncbi:MFS transporter [Falsiroseomonas sp. CW058]|uniref:MFS transporter n=1 Tax=Falsiroseomonas sp. CW058 TaxID=3388664 RepID=UPI003D31B26B